MPLCEAEFQREFCVEHLDEAEYLLQQRPMLVTHSFARPEHVLAQDLRLLAHLQGLLLRPEVAWAVLLETLPRRPVASLLQMGAWLALCRHDATGIRSVCALDDGHQLSRLQPAELVRWLPEETHVWLLAQPFGAAGPEMLALQAHARVERREVSDWLAALPLDALLGSAHGPWLDAQFAHALILSDELPSQDLMLRLQAFESLQWACLLALMRHGFATPAAQERAWSIPSTHALAKPVLTAVASALPPGISAPPIAHLFASLRRKEALWCCVAAGSPALLPELVRHLRGMDAELARLCLFALLGVPEHLEDESDPQFDSHMEAQVAAFADEADPRLRLLDGKARTDAVVADALARGFQFQRALAWRLSPRLARCSTSDPLRPAFPH